LFLRIEPFNLPKLFLDVKSIENRIPLFLVGKPGSSKSLSKAMVVDAMKGKRSESAIFREMKQVLIGEYYCILFFLLIVEMS